MRLTDGDMKQTAFIGITGGVGSGKSEVLKYLRERTGSRIFCADEEAKKLYIPGSPVFDRIVSAAGRDILDEKGQPDRARFSEKLFKDKSQKQISEITACFTAARNSSAEEVLNIESRAFYRLMAEKNGGNSNA